MDKDRLKYIIEDFKDVINQKNWDVLFSDGKISIPEKIMLAKLLLEHEPKIFAGISFTTDVQTLRNILEGLSHIVGIDDNYELEKADYVGRLFDGDQPTEQVINDTINIARYLGYDCYTTDCGYWGDYDGIIVYPDADIKDWYNENKEPDDEEYDEWEYTCNVRYVNKWL